MRAVVTEEEALSMFGQYREQMMAVLSRHDLSGSETAAIANILDETETGIRNLFEKRP
jgi:hypothetical protein